MTKSEQVRQPSLLGMGLLVVIFGIALGSFQHAWAQGDLLEQVRDADVLRVGMTVASPPWSMLDEQNQPAGYDVDVANALATCLDVSEVEIIPGGFDTFIAGVQSERVDIVISGQTITEARLEQVDFSDPYQVNGVAIFVAESNETIQSEADLAGKRIGVSEGSTQEAYARENIPGADVRTYTNATLALRDIAIGRADAAIFSRWIGGYLAAQNDLAVKPLPGLLNSEVNGMSFPKGETAFGEAVDACLDEMISNGTLTEISRTWLGGLDMAEELAKLDTDD